MYYKTYDYMCHHTKCCVLIYTARLIYDRVHIQRVFTIFQYEKTLSWQRSLEHRKQSIDLQCKSLDWFLFDSDLCHKRVKNLKGKWRHRECSGSSFRFMLFILCEYIPKSLSYTFLNGVDSDLCCGQDKSSVDTKPIHNKNCF